MPELRKIERNRKKIKDFLMIAEIEYCPKGKGALYEAKTLDGLQ